MRKVTMLLAAIAVMVPLFAAATYAATIAGTRQGEILLESDRNDTIFGRGGGDEIGVSIFGNDRDVAYGNAGNDRIRADDGDVRDTLNGGNGDDLCVGDLGDEFISCETEDTPTPTRLVSQSARP